MNELLKDLGLQESEINKILNNEKVKDLREEKLLDNFKALINVMHLNNLSLEEAKGIIIKSPRLLSFSPTTLENKIESLKDKGLINIKGMLKKNKSLLTLSEENIDLKINGLVNLGFHKENVLEMLNTEASIFNYNMDTIKGKIDKLARILSNKEIESLVTSWPNVICRDIDSINERIHFLSSIGAKDYALNKPMVLTQGINKTYARVMYIKDHNKNIADAFKGTKEFNQKYTAKDADLLERYKYENSSYKEEYKERFK